MATERTAAHGFGGVVYFAVADETYAHGFGGTINGDITAAAGGRIMGPLAGNAGLAGHGGLAGIGGGLAGGYYSKAEE